MNKGKFVTILLITTIFFLLFALVSCTSLSGGDTPTDENTSDMITWQKTYGGSGEDVAYSIQRTSDGGYIVAGYTTSFDAGGRDVYILKLDRNGNKVWERTYGGSNWDGAYSIQQTSDGGYIVAGGTGSVFDFNMDVYILKLDRNGNL